MSSQTNLFDPLDDIEMEILDEFLMSWEHDDGLCNISELDGFFTAIVSGPEMIMPSEWLDAVWGGEEYAPQWDSEEQAQQIFSLMMRLMNSVSTTLMEAPEEFDPLFSIGWEEEEDRAYIIVDEWCLGYMRGIELRADAWQLDDDSVLELLFPIPIFVHEQGAEVLRQLSDDEREMLKGEIAPAASAVHAFWLAQRTPEGHIDPYIRMDDKVGRNDPCPCGSGKKYKKCCGLH